MPVFDPTTAFRPYPTPIKLWHDFGDFVPSPEFGPGPIRQYRESRCQDTVVTHVPALGFFYGHPDSETVRQDMVECFTILNLDKRHSMDSVKREDVRLGRTYAGVYADDGDLYRCDVLGRGRDGDPDTWLVFFVDYGEHAMLMTSMLFEIEDDYVRDQLPVHTECFVMEGMPLLFAEQVKDNAPMVMMYNDLKRKILGKRVVVTPAHNWRNVPDLAEEDTEASKHYQVVVYKGGENINEEVNNCQN